MMEEMDIRPPVPNYPVYQKLAEFLTCQDMKCNNRRKGQQFTFCYVDPRSKYHTLVPASDINAWKTAIGDGIATLQNPPVTLFAKWSERQDRELAKLADEPESGGGRSGHRYASGRGPANTQNVNINFGDGIGSAILSKLQNSAAQAPGEGEPDLPQLPPSEPKRNFHSKGHQFELPVRSSSPPQPIEGSELLDFLRSFKTQYFSQNPRASLAIDNIIQVAGITSWNLTDLLAQPTASLEKQGLPGIWIPIIRSEAKAYVKRNAEAENTALEGSKVTAVNSTEGGRDERIAAILAELRSNPVAARDRHESLSAGIYSIGTPSLLLLAISLTSQNLQLEFQPLS
jgi:hypothetical protein